MITLDDDDRAASRYCPYAPGADRRVLQPFFETVGRLREFRISGSPADEDATAEADDIAALIENRDT